MSDTPKTDALWQNAKYESLRYDHKISRWSDFARELERENAKLRELLAAVVCHEFSGVECKSVNGKAWWDERDAVLANEKAQTRSGEQPSAESAL